MPLVLHGGTGIPDDMIKKAIDLGVSKINVNTECQLAFAAATRKYIEEGKDQQGKGFDPRKLLAPWRRSYQSYCKRKNRTVRFCKQSLSLSTKMLCRIPGGLPPQGPHSIFFREQRVEVRACTRP